MRGRTDDCAATRRAWKRIAASSFWRWEIKILLRVPMDCWRQWIRHRTANVNEYSTRYSLAIDAAQATRASEWRTQAEANRQGSGQPLPIDLGTRLTVEIPLR